MAFQAKGTRNHIVALSLGVTVLGMLLTACATGPSTRGPRVRAPLPVGAMRCPTPPPCGEHCSNQPFEPTDCWTTKYGPARADVVLASTNFLYCNGGAYALCFFSGPPDRTGTERNNRPLPCVLTGDVANCTCQVYTSGPYFVDINAILNLGAYYETVQACGHDGALCANLKNCGLAGTAEDCDTQKTAPVCRYVQHQNPNDPKVSLMPKADLVSAFSFAMHADYKIGKTDCEDPGLYAGCMTAPCFFPPGAKNPPSDGDPIQCQCPTFRGPYQVGQPEQVCRIPPSDGKVYVWSASDTISDGDHHE